MIHFSFSKSVWGGAGDMHLFSEQEFDRIYILQQLLSISFRKHFYLFVSGFNFFLWGGGGFTTIKIPPYLVERGSDFDAKNFVIFFH